jgi:hypothetical protein
MGYLDEILSDRRLELTNSALRCLVWDSRVRGELRRLGFDMVAFETGYSYTNVQDAELFLYPEGQPGFPTGIRAPSRVNAFEGLLVQNSIARLLLDFSDPAGKILGRSLNEPLYAEHRERVLFTFGSLAGVAELPDRHFVFAHVVAPQPPFVFDSEGNPLTPDYPFNLADGTQYFRASAGTREEYIAAYRGQFQYVNELVIEAIDGVLAVPDQPPIVILQGDHGPGAYLLWGDIMASDLTERSAILNAYLLPGVPSDVPYDMISPINSFRMVLSLYFGANLAPLPDCVFFSSISDRARFQQVGGCYTPGGTWGGRS